METRSLCDVSGMLAGRGFCWVVDSTSLVIVASGVPIGLVFDGWDVADGSRSRLVFHQCTQLRVASSTSSMVRQGPCMVISSALEFPLHTRPSRCGYALPRRMNVMTRDLVIWRWLTTILVHDG